MKSNRKRWYGVIAVVSIIVGLMAGSVSPSWAEKPNQDLGVVPTQTKVDGMKYDEWSVEWWQWSLSVPVEQNPLFDGPNCANGGVGQEGPVWFLTGFFSGNITRFCNVPAGKYLFLPIINVECSTLEADPFFGANKRELRKCATGFQFSDVSATIDGVDVVDIDTYLTRSPLFDFTVPENNWLGVVGPDDGQSVANGYYLMLQPLEVGDVRNICLGGSFPDLGFSVAGCYTVTGVAP